MVCLLYWKCVTFCPVIVLMALFPLLAPPSPPHSVEAEGTSPQSITVTFLQPVIWNSLFDITYNLTYRPVKDGNLAFIMFSSLVDRNVAEREKRLIEGLEENTTYIITVRAINDFGSSVPSESVLASSKAFTSEAGLFSCRAGGKVAIAFCLLAGDAGALLVSDSQTLFYYQVNDASVLRLDEITQSPNELHTFPATILGLCVCIHRCVLSL